MADICSRVKYVAWRKKKEVWGPENHRKPMGKWCFNGIVQDLPSGNDCYSLLWKIWTIEIGDLLQIVISMAMLHDQRVRQEYFLLMFSIPFGNL